MKIGLSISFCVRDIAWGQVQLDQVAKIVAGTNCECDAHWDELIARYKDIYWRGHESQCEQILRDLLASGRIEQPRVVSKRCPCISQGHWVDDESQIQYGGNETVVSPDYDEKANILVGLIGKTVKAVGPSFIDEQPSDEGVRLVFTDGSFLDVGYSTCCGAIAVAISPQEPC